MKKILFIILLFFTIGVSAKTKVVLDKCVDGDTAWLKKGAVSLKYRFLAIDTPEIRHPFKKTTSFGETASDYTCNSLTNASLIEIEYDSNSTKTDKYGRELVWIYLDNKLFQLDLIEQGYAKVDYIYGKYMYLDKLKEKEDLAKQSKIGIWGNIFIVTFKYKDFINKVEVIEGSKVEPINIQKIKGYEFLGWYLNDEPFDFNTIINSDIELIGKYRQSPIEIRIILLIVLLILLYFLDRKKFDKEFRKIKKKAI